jgi:hypothetical protein
LAKILFYISLFFLFQASLFGQYVFNKNYYSNIALYDNKFLRSNAIIQTSEGSYVTGGAGKGGLSISAIKLDYKGDTLWTFATNFDDTIYTKHILSIIEASDHNFILTGDMVDSIPNAPRTFAFILKLDGNTGNLLWIHNYTSNNQSTYFLDIKETADKGFIACGSIFNKNNLGYDIDNDAYLVKTDSLGNFEWGKNFVGTGYEPAYSVEIADDGGFFVFGSEDSFGSGGIDPYLFKTDSQGNQLWTRSYGTSFPDYPVKMKKLHNGELAFVSYTYCGVVNFSYDTIYSTAYKVNSLGDIIWRKNYRSDLNELVFNDIKELQNGDLVVCANEKINSTTNRINGVINTLDFNNGNIVWNNHYELFEEDSIQHFLLDLDVTADGGVVAAGMIMSLKIIPTYPSNSMWVVKTDCQGNETFWDNGACTNFIGLEEIEKDALFNLYPNPSTGTVTLDYFIPQNAENQSISFYDATGKLVQKVDFSGEGQIQLNIDCSGFSNGVYQCVLVSDGEVMQQGKLVVIK